MKGYSKEMIELLLLIIGFSILIILSYFLFTSGVPLTRTLPVEKHQFEILGEASKNIFYARIPEIDKIFTQMLGDRIIQDDEIVYYGDGFGGINVTEIVYGYFDNYFQKNWKLSISLELRNAYILWIPNSASSSEGSISKISSINGNEVGRYYTAPSGIYGNPSRVSLDSKGNVWVGNRNTRTIVKVGLLGNSQCVDKNNNGIIETSQDLNMNGVIDPNEILAFGKDECLLSEVFLGGSGYGNFKSLGVRAVCVDQEDNVYAGMFGDKKLYYISKDGEVLNSWGIGVPPYGCFVDRNGIVWVSGVGTGNLLRFDPKTENSKTFTIGHTVYGIAPCFNEDCLVINGWGNNKLTKFNTTTNEIIFTLSKPELNKGRGIIVDQNEDIYAVSTSYGLVVKYDKYGAEIKRAPTCVNPTGVGLDILDKIWVTCLDTHIVGYDNNLNPKRRGVFGNAHYVYNFFTSYNLEIEEIERTINFGYEYDNIKRARTFHIPIPIPGEIGRSADGVLYVW